MRPFNNRFKTQNISGLDSAYKVSACSEFRFQGFSQIVEHKCWITLISENNKVKHVVCSQLNNYYGTSITNAAELIRQHLIDEHNLELESTWLEHYKKGLGLSIGSYSLCPVTFDDKNNPAWDQDLSWETASKKFDIPLSALAFGFEDELKK